MRCWWRIPGTTGSLWNASDEEIGQFLRLAARADPGPQARSADQVREFVQGLRTGAGQEFSHPTSQITATMFVPRRVLYELRAGREYFQAKERCVFCDSESGGRQASRVIEARGDYVALVPMLRACLTKPGFCRAIMRRRLSVRVREAGAAQTSRPFAAHLAAGAGADGGVSSGAAHFAKQFAPSKTLGYWKTIDDDYHWHIEIMPVAETKAKSYTFKEVYYSPVSSETAVKQLREAKIDG